MVPDQPQQVDGAVPVLHKRPLTWDEIPLPPGYQRSVLDPGTKEILRLQHDDRIQEVLAERNFILARAEEDTLYQDKVLAVCEKDPAWFIDHFVWTYDDRMGVEEPMILYPFQNEKMVEPYLELRESPFRKRVTNVDTKSRGIGATCVHLALRLHSISFLDGWSVLVGGVSLDDVDDGGLAATHESHFGKVRFMIDNLPGWMKDKLYGPLITSDKWNKRHLIRNPKRPRNFLSGRQFSGMFGRGHRFSECFGDEIAWADEMEAADTSLKQTTDRFHGVTTPNGKSTFHYQLWSGALPGVRRAYIHWSEHPGLSVEWYNEQREHMTQEQIAQELDCNFEGSAGGRVLKEVTLDSHFVLHDKEDASGMLVGAYEPGLPLHVIIDPGIADPIAITWGQWDEGRGEGRVVDFVQKEDVTIDWLVPFVLGQIPRATHRGLPWPHDYGPVEHEIIERHAKWSPPEIIYGDHYGTARAMSTGLSAYDELANYGIYVLPIRVEDDLAAITRCELLLRYVRFAHRLIDQRNGPAETCPTMGEVVTQWRYPRRKIGDFRPVTRPVHDKFCHGGDTLKMWALQINLPEATEQPVSSGKVKRARGSDLVGGRTRWSRRRRR